MLKRKSELEKESNNFEAKIVLNMDYFKEQHYGALVAELEKQFEAVRQMAMRRLKDAQSGK